MIIKISQIPSLVITADSVSFKSKPAISAATASGPTSRKNLFFPLYVY